jgi:hypothetical protein
MGGMCSLKREYDRCPLQRLQALQKRHSPDVIGGNIISTFCNEIIPGAAGRKNKPNGKNGVNHPSMFCIPAHVWASPILHNELGLMKDWFTQVKKLCNTHIEMLPDEEVNIHEHHIILGDMEVLLIEQDDLSPKETIKEYKSYLKRINKEIKNGTFGLHTKNNRCDDPSTRTGVPLGAANDCQVEMGN